MDKEIQVIEYWFSIRDMKTGFKSNVYKNVTNDLFAVDTLNKEGMRVAFVEPLQNEDDCYEQHRINIENEINK